MPRATLAALSVYPVKGCRGITLRRARVAARGLVAIAGEAVAGDREWMIVDRDGRFVTQREEPRLALIATSLGANALVLSAPGVAPLVLPLDAPRGPAREVVVWRSRVIARDAGALAADWLSV